MWTINSNDVMHAKDRLERRRSELETRYVEEKGALDAEFAVIDTLERVAAEFAGKHVPEDLGFVAAEPSPSPPATEPDPSGFDQQTASAEEDQSGQAAAAADPPGGDDVSGGFDILKPGSRWRLNRGNRPAAGEGAGSGNPPTNW
jgi:hypothetical protein